MTLSDNLVSSRPADSVDRAGLTGAVLFVVDSADPSRVIPVTLADLLGTVAETGGASEAKLEQVRSLLAGTLTTQRALQPTTNLASAIGAGSSQGSNVNCEGRTVLRVLIGDAWTGAALTFETSADGVTWRTLYDPETNLPVQITSPVAGRGYTVVRLELVGINHIRARSGVPGSYVNQAAATGVTFLTQSL